MNSRGRTDPSSRPDSSFRKGGRESYSVANSRALGDFLPAFVLAVGCLARLIPAWRLFLNPDEALHNLLASQSSLGAAYQAALTNAHPPLLILLLYFWRDFAQSELWLRLPSVLAGTAACWLFYQWLKLVSDRATAFFGLLLAAFAPALISLSAEVRQYALLLFFMTACLYLSELAFKKRSSGWMLLFSLSLYGAILTHYSSLIFAFSIGVYMLARFYSSRRAGLFLVWAAGQLGGIALALYFVLTHLPRLRSSGMAREGFDSYLQKSIYHPGGGNAVVFVAAQSVRVFTYLFSHGVVGTLVLLAFVAGVIWLFRQGEAPDYKGPSPRILALLIALPFVTAWGVALAGVYPLGATRHSIFLAPFAITGASIGISRLIAVREWIKQLALLASLALCNFFPAPPPPIHPRDQSRARMQEAASYLRAEAKPGAVFLADYESGLLLGYYVCGYGVVQVFPPLKPMAEAECGPYRVIASSDREWKFLADTIPSRVDEATRNFGLTSNSELWIFYAGWINDSAPALTVKLEALGCGAPKKFGENILACRLDLGSTTKK
jgi:hypothetical protein